MMKFLKSGSLVPVEKFARSARDFIRQNRSGFKRRFELYSFQDEEEDDPNEPTDDDEIDETEDDDDPAKYEEEE